MIIPIAPTGGVGNGPYSVWLDLGECDKPGHDHKDRLMPESYGFKTAGDAFRHKAKIEQKMRKRLSAVDTLTNLITEDVLEADDDNEARKNVEDKIGELREALSDAKLPEVRVFKLTEVTATDVSTLPTLDLNVKPLGGENAA